MNRLILLVVGGFLNILPFHESLAQEPRKSDLRVLYVGLNAEPGTAPELKATQSTPTKFPERKKELALRRPEEFKEFLDRYFNQVTVTTTIQYRPADSEAHDVTVFDEVPGFIDGQRHRLSIPKNFAKPAIMVGEAGPDILKQSGFSSKLDYL